MVEKIINEIVVKKYNILKCSDLAIAEGNKNSFASENVAFLNKINKGLLFQLNVEQCYFKEMGASSSFMANPFPPDDNIVIYSDGLRLNEDGSYTHYKNICGEQIECQPKMTKDDFRKLFATTFDKLTAEGKITDEVISKVTERDIEQKLIERLGGNQNVRNANRELYEMLSTNVDLVGEASKTSIK